MMCVRLDLFQVNQTMLVVRPKIELEVDMLAILFEWLLTLPEEFILSPSAPDEFSGPAYTLENKPPSGERRMVGKEGG